MKQLTRCAIVDFKFPRCGINKVLLCLIFLLSVGTNYMKVFLQNGRCSSSCQEEYGTFDLHYNNNEHPHWMPNGIPAD